MPYCQLFYHLVWSTKHREPRITPEVEPIIYNLLRTKAIGLGGTVFALNGSIEHVHLVTTIPSRIAVATFVGQVKGVASAKLNKSRPGAPPFYWQEEYGALPLMANACPMSSPMSKTRSNTTPSIVPFPSWNEPKAKKCA